MTLRDAVVRVFGALRDLRVSFGPGVTVVLGENEAGKSTLFAAIRHALLTPAKLTRSQFAHRLGRYLPRPDGTAVECELVVDLGGEYRLRRRWGTDAYSLITTPDGAEISGDEADSRLRTLLPVTPGTFQTIFLVDQSQLDATLDRIGGDAESRDEIAAMLRRTKEETGGVSIEAFQRVLDDRSRALFGRWDRDRNRPEGGRGIENEWQRDVGELLRAYYDLERAKAELDQTLRAEQALEAANAALEDAAGRLRTAEEFVRRHAEAYETLRRSAELDREISSQSTLLADLRRDGRRWAVVDEEARTARDELVGAERAAEQANAALARVDEVRAAAERRALYDRARAAEKEVVEVRARLAQIAPVDPDALAELREVEREHAELRAKLSVGTLRARLSARAATSVTAASDDDDAREIDLGPMGDETLEAHRRLRFEKDGLVITVETGDEPYDRLLERAQQLEERSGELAAALGAARAEEAAQRRRDREAAARELEAAERRLGGVLGDASLEELRAEFGARATIPEEAGERDAGATAEQQDALDPREVARQASEAHARLGSVKAQVASLSRERDALVERYASQEALEDRLAEVKTALSELESRRGATTTVPDGFQTADDFLTEFERRQVSLDRLRDEYQQARIEQARVLERLPERTGEEVRDAVGEAERRFAQAERRAAAIERLEAATRTALAEQTHDPFAPFAASVARYLAATSDDAYEVVHDDDPLVPSRFVRRPGPDLEYELLSQGTRDMVALAIRLALAETASRTGAPAPLFLDDPLVDMDPHRRALAARAIERYADGRQVVVFTCHPEHAEIFRGAARVEFASR
ncbi:MAG: AAA family ATPase [bacterium]